MNSPIAVITHVAYTPLLGDVIEAPDLSAYRQRFILGPASLYYVPMSRRFRRIARRAHRQRNRPTPEAPPARDMSRYRRSALVRRMRRDRWLTLYYDERIAAARRERGNP